MLLKDCLPSFIKEIKREDLYKSRWILVITLGFSNSVPAETSMNAEDWFQIETMIFEYIKPNNSEKMGNVDKKFYPKDIIAIEENSKLSREVGGANATAKALSIENEYSSPNEKITFELERESARRFNIDLIEAVIKKSSQNQSEDTYKKNPNPDENSFREKIIKELIFQLNSSADGQLAFKDFSGLAELKEIKEKIERSADMRVLDYKSWIQPIRSDLTSIMIQGTAEQEGRSEIEGFITLYRKRYLHVSTNLWFTKLQKKSETESSFSSAGEGDFESEVTNSDASNSSVSATFMMKQKRRVRVNELHYLDHPLFGLVLKITRFKKDEQKN